MFIQTLFHKLRSFLSFSAWKKLSVLVVASSSRNVHKRFIWTHTKQIVRDSLFQFIGIGILVGFLLYLLHILLGLSFGVQQISQNIQHKLWAYFYIKDSPSKADETYSKVIDMKDKLEKLGMKVTYLSKDDAIRSIGRKVPSVIESFEKYGIKNPLPATMYVLFDDMEQYEKLRKVVTVYEDIIANREDISKSGENIKEQEKRILHILWFTNFIVYLTYFLVLVLIIVIVSFLMLVVRTKFDTFRKVVIIQQLLGTDYTLIKTPFILTSVGIVIIGFVLSLVFFAGTGMVVGWYTTSLFQTSLMSLIGASSGSLVVLLIAELLILTWLVTIIWYSYLQQLLLKSANT